MAGTEWSGGRGRRQRSGTKIACALRKWRVPPLPASLRPRATVREHRRWTLIEAGKLAKSRLSQAEGERTRTRMELSLADWVYEMVRMNIKRGRVFEVDDVLREGQADCLGYARLFQYIGRSFGLDAGICEVLIDNSGRRVPHVVNILRLSDGRTRFVDLWYGSRNIRHRRLGVMIRRGGRWQPVDADRKDMPHFGDVRGLPPRCVDAIARYMMGNRHLERAIRLSDASGFHEAVSHYTAAIERYPQNARFYFNRAIAYENLGDRKAAEADYAFALRDEASLVRVQARQYDEVVRLIGLDQIEVSARAQRIYLLWKGFVTGRGVSLERIATLYRVSADEAGRITSRIESQLASATWNRPGGGTPPRVPDLRDSPADN